MMVWFLTGRDKNIFLTIDVDHGARRDGQNAFAGGVIEHDPDEHI